MQPLLCVCLVGGEGEDKETSRGRERGEERKERGDSICGEDTMHVLSTGRL